VLPSVECSWLTLGGIDKGDPMAVRMTGVAGSPGDAQTKISQALAAAGVNNANLDLDGVAIIRPEGCSAIDTFRKIRKTGALHMSATQQDYERERQPAGSQYPIASQAVIDLKPVAGQDLTLLGIEPGGPISEVLGDRTVLDAAASDGTVQQVKPGEYRLNINMDHTGWSGLILLTGEGPFDPKITRPPLNARGPDWQNNFVATASERDWKSEMIWFRSVDKKPN
jgi:serine/threonine-protein kinase